MEAELLYIPALTMGLLEPSAGSAETGTLVSPRLRFGFYYLKFIVLGFYQCTLLLVCRPRRALPARTKGERCLNSKTNTVPFDGVRRGIPHVGCDLTRVPCPVRHCIAYTPFQGHDQLTRFVCQVTVYGAGFYKSDAIACAFGDVTVAAMFLSENAVRCRHTPPPLKSFSFFFFCTQPSGE